MFMTFLVLACPCLIFNLGLSKRLQCANQVAKSEWLHFLTSFWIRFVSHDFIWFHMISYIISWYNMFFFLLKAKDNIEALSLALFVECFIGENLGSAVSGGFVMSSGQVPKWKMSMLGKLWGKMIGSTVYFYVLNVFYMFYFLELLEVVWTQRCYFWNFVVMHGCHFGIQTCLFLQPVFELSRPLWPIALTTKTWLSES